MRGNRLFVNIVILVAIGFSGANASAKMTYWQEQALKFDDFFREKVHPTIKNAYSYYYERWGKDIGEVALITLRELSKQVRGTSEMTYDYWQGVFPDQFAYVERIPAPVKRGYESFILSLWRGLNSTDQAVEHMPEKYKDASDFAVMIIEAIKNAGTHPELPRLQHLLDRLRPYVADSGMKDCYQVSIVDMGFNNAFNTGCNIFVTAKMVEELSDDQLIAVLAHEISHGDHGHSVESVFNFLGSGTKHVTVLVLDELLWFATGEKTERLESVLNDGNLPIVLEAFGKKAPEQEVEADHFGACLLKRAGLPQEWMRETLLVLHRVTAEEYKKMILDDDNVVGDNVREYPSLRKRMDASICDL